MIASNYKWTMTLSFGSTVQCLGLPTQYTVTVLEDAAALLVVEEDVVLHARAKRHGAAIMCDK